MEFPNLNEKQKFIINLIKEKIGSQYAEQWLFLKNKHFKNNAPIDYILSENYDYFHYIIES